jgi:ribosome-associated protein
MEDTLPAVEQPDGAAPDKAARAAEAAKAAEAVRAAVALGQLLREHQGGDVVVLDLREMNAWTDFFVIATATSGAHLRGMERHIKELCREQDLEILRRSRKPNAGDDEWCLIDLGPIVVHLMNGRARAFYELERLYAQATPAMPATPIAPA